MVENDPAYRGEYESSIADYDYESGLLRHNDQPEDMPATAASDEPVKERSRMRLRILAAAIGAIIGAFVGSFLGGMQTSQQYTHALPPASSGQSTWNDDFEPVPTRVPRVVPSLPTPVPIPPPPPLRCTDNTPHPSTQAVAAELDEVAAAWRRLGPPGVPLSWPSPSPGYTWVVGPPGQVPVPVQDERVKWWWNWRVDSNGCGEYWLESVRHG